jgi:phospholipid/cholesterol/gamma-HCH transport system permease protein
MTPVASPVPWFVPMGRATIRWLSGWWYVVHFAAVILALALTASTFDRANRDALARNAYADTAPILLWFTVLCALISLVVTRILVVTALSYGLSQYALEAVIRVLVLELIPLTAALFVALRCTIPNGAELSQMRARGDFEVLRAQGIEPIAREVLPRVVAGVFATVTLAALSCVVALILAYYGVYGFTLSGVAGYTRMFGRVFDPSTSIIFVLKTLFFALAVSSIPTAAALYDIEGDGTRTSAELQGLVRMFAVLLLIEMLSLVGNYY